MSSLLHEYCTVRTVLLSAGRHGYIVAQREPRCSFLVKFGGGGGDFFSGALRLSVTTPRQPFGLVLRSTRAPPNNMFSQRFITCTWYTWYLLCKNTKIWRSTNYSSITLQYDLSHRVPTFDLWMLAPQERKVVFHEHSLQKLARVTMAENAVKHSSIFKA